VSTHSTNQYGEIARIVYHQLFNGREKEPDHIEITAKHLSLNDAIIQIYCQKAESQTHFCITTD
jgi:hypothetical protein